MAERQLRTCSKDDSEKNISGGKGDYRNWFCAGHRVKIFVQDWSSWVCGEKDSLNINILVVFCVMRNHIMYTYCR